MSIAMTRRKIELDNGASDLTKALTTAGAVVGGVYGGPAGAATGMNLGQTVGGLADGQQQKDRLEAAQKPIAGTPPPIIEQKQDDFDKAIGMLKVGGNAYGSFEKPSPEQSPTAGQAPLPPPEPGSGTPAFNRRMAMLKGYY